MVGQVPGAFGFRKKPRLHHPGVLEQRISGAKRGSRAMFPELTRPVLSFAFFYFKAASLYEGSDIRWVHLFLTNKE